MECGDNLGNLAVVECPPDNTLLASFTEVIVCNVLELPPQKPDIEHITNVTVEPVVTDIEVIDVNLGDAELYKKVAVSGNISIGIEYSADEPEQQVHFAHFNVPFQGLIGYRPCTVNRGLLPSTFDIDNYTVKVCVEHEQFHVVDSRHIRAVVVLLVWLDPNPTP